MVLALWMASSVPVTNKFGACFFQRRKERGLEAQGMSQRSRASVGHREADFADRAGVVEREGRCRGTSLVLSILALRPLVKRGNYHLGLASPWGR